MQIVEIEYQQKRWIAAVYANELNGKAFLSGLSSNGHTVVHKKIELDSFPVFAVQYAAENSTYEYMNNQSLIERIAGIERQAEQQTEYFTYYLFEGEYFQPTGGTETNAYSVSVNNNFLRDYYDEYGPRCVTRELLENLAYYVDVEGMHRFYERCMASGTDDDKAELVEAYMQLFGQMCYDYACNKFSYEGLLEITSIVEKIETLQGETLWELRGDAYLNLLEAAAEEDPENVLAYGTTCIEALKMYISEVGNEYSTCEKLSRVYHLLADHDEENRFEHWCKAFDAIEDSMRENPTETNWIYLLQLLYTPLSEENDQIRFAASEEKKSFKALIEHMQDVPGIHFRIAQDLQRLQDSPAYDISDEDYLFWLNASVDRPINAAIDLYDFAGAGHFYHKEGVRFQRLDLLQRALDYYTVSAENDASSGFTIYYIARTLEDMATVYLSIQHLEKADEYISKALAYYSKHEALIENNFSCLCHYAEFLERCYHYTGKISRPSLEKIKALALLAEKEGNGFYGLPFFIQARTALVEGDEATAVFQLRRSLLLHELCIDKDIKLLHETYQNSEFPLLKNFLDETLQFMNEVDDGYYYDPEIRWPEIKTLNASEIKDAWENRMQEIKKRRQE